MAKNKVDYTKWMLGGNGMVRMRLTHDDIKDGVIYLNLPKQVLETYIKTNLTALELDVLDQKRPILIVVRDSEIGAEYGMLLEKFGSTQYRLNGWGNLVRNRKRKGELMKLQSGALIGLRWAEQHFNFSVEARWNFAEILKENYFT